MFYFLLYVLTARTIFQKSIVFIEIRVGFDLMIYSEINLSMELSCYVENLN